MRINKDNNSNVLEGDLTPMIDMTFQLIAFFMVLINFNNNAQHERVQLPSSTLAKPQEGKPKNTQITIHMVKEGLVSIAASSVPGDISIESLGPQLDLEKSEIISKKEKVSDASIIIRGHMDAETGKIRELITKCQEAGFELFKLRANEDVGNSQ